MKTMLATVVALAALNTTADAATGGDRFQKHWVDSLKACAGNKGKTARKAYTISAGPDRVFIPDTIRFVPASAAGKKTGIWFHSAQYKIRTVPLTTALGHTYDVEMPTTIVVEPFAETGSGKFGHVCAWNNGYIHAETIEIE